ncbi:MAG: hypothetical protein FJ267_12170, partial [Planctomycetes bacterium]|nr:hypothetical protein [Planctomycetota bacterium]
MNGFRFIKGVAVSLATLGAAFPQIQVVAAESPQSNVRPAAKSTQSAGLADIALTAGGTFTGRIVDHTGKAIEGAEVVLRQNQKV